MPADRTSTIISYAVLAFFAGSFVIPGLLGQLKDNLRAPVLSGFELATLIIFVQACFGILRYVSDNSTIAKISNFLIFLQEICPLPILTTTLYLQNDQNLIIAWLHLIEIPILIVIRLLNYQPDHQAQLIRGCTILTAISLAFISIWKINIHGVLADITYTASYLVFTDSYSYHHFSGVIIRNLCLSLFVVLSHLAVYHY